MNYDTQKFHLSTLALTITEWLFKIFSTVANQQQFTFLMKEPYFYCDGNHPTIGFCATNLDILLFAQSSYLQLVVFLHNIVSIITDRLKKIMKLCQEYDKSFVYWLVNTPGIFLSKMEDVQVWHQIF